jgi:hypothetical protein
MARSVTELSAVVDRNLTGSQVALMRPRLVKVAEDALVALEAAIKDGEPVYNMEGEETGRRPVRARDLAVVVKMCSDKATELEQMERGELPEDTRISLKQLAEGLAEFARQARRREKVVVEGTADVIDG